MCYLGAHDLVETDGAWELPATSGILKVLPQGVQAFGHVDFEGRIVKGLPFHMEKNDSSLRQPGKIKGFFRITLPEDAVGKTFPVRLGLWVYQGRRIVPDNGMPDLRVDVGTLKQTQEGKRKHSVNPIQRGAMMRVRDREPVVSLPSFGALEFLDTPLGSEIPLQPELATRISTARAHVAHDTAFTSFTLVGYPLFLDSRLSRILVV